MYHLPEQGPTISPRLQRENLIYVSFFQLYSTMMRLIRQNYEVRNSDCYKPIPVEVIRLADQQYESLKSITSYDLNARPVEDRVYAWQIYDVDPLYSTTLFLINELGYTELALLALEYPLVYQTNEEWLPYAEEMKLDDVREGYIDPRAGCYLVPLKLLTNCDLSLLSSWYRGLGRSLVRLTLDEYFLYTVKQQTSYPERHLTRVLAKEETREKIVSCITQPTDTSNEHHPFYDELTKTYDFTTDVRLGRVLDIALNYESWQTRHRFYPWLLSLYCICRDLFKIEVPSGEVTSLYTYCKLHSDAPKILKDNVKTYITCDIACTAKELVTFLTHGQKETSNL